MLEATSAEILERHQKVTVHVRDAFEYSREFGSVRFRLHLAVADGNLVRVIRFILHFDRGIHSYMLVAQLELFAFSARAVYLQGLVVHVVHRDDGLDEFVARFLMQQFLDNFLAALRKLDDDLVAELF